MHGEDRLIVRQCHEQCIDPGEWDPHVPRCLAKVAKTGTTADGFAAKGDMQVVRPHVVADDGLGQGDLVAAETERIQAVGRQLGAQFFMPKETEAQPASGRRLGRPRGGLPTS